MTKLSNLLRQGRSIVPKAVAITGLSALAIMGASPAADASGTSAPAWNCYSTWGSTGSSGHCHGAAVDNSWQNYGVCAWQSDSSSGWTWVGKGSWIDDFGQVDCTWQIRFSYLNYANANP